MGRGQGVDAVILREWVRQCNFVSCGGGEDGPDGPMAGSSARRMAAHDASSFEILVQQPSCALLCKMKECLVGHIPRQRKKMLGLGIRVAIEPNRFKA